MKFIVGVGNPGKEYDGTRHNIGFAVVDEIGSKFAVKWSKDSSLKALKAELEQGVVLLKPQTYVNKTGETVSAIVKYGTKNIELLFICDDVNLECGKLRLRTAGSAGGHHGLESVIQALGREDFPRLRLGVGNSTMPKDLVDFVLGPFNQVEKKQMEAAVKNAAEVSREWLEKDFESAMKKLSVLQGKSSIDA